MIARTLVNLVQGRVKVEERAMTYEEMKETIEKPGNWYIKIIREKEWEMSPIEALSLLWEVLTDDRGPPQKRNALSFLYTHKPVDSKNYFWHGRYQRYEGFSYSKVYLDFCNGKVNMTSGKKAKIKLDSFGTICFTRPKAKKQ